MISFVNFKYIYNFFLHNDDGSGAGTISQTPQPNESYLCRLEDLKTCEQERQTQIMRMREEMREEMRTESKA